MTSAGTTDGGPACAVVINPSKVVDLNGRRDEIHAAFAAVGWPQPLWLETTVEDPGFGQTRAAIDAGCRIVFACGGDGTVMSCLSVLAGTEVALAVLPAGTGNLLAANLGLPSDITDSVALAASGQRRRIDVGALESAAPPGVHPSMRFAIMAGMGFDAQLVDGAHETLKARIGWPAYVLAALKHLRDRPMAVTVRLDGGRPLRRRARTVLIGNVGRLQGGLQLMPQARPDDGHFDVAIIAPRSLMHWLTLAYGVLARRPNIARLELHTARHVTVRSRRPQPCELDGDAIPATRELSVGIIPAALLVCAPNEADGPIG
jgi:diacylglycerol kinase family enzyme